MDDARLRTSTVRELFERQRLKNDESCGQLERPPRRRVAVDVPVDVRPGECHDQRLLWLVTSKLLDGWKTFPGMQGHEGVAQATVVLRSDGYAVSELTEYPRPPACGHAVPGASAPWCRRDYFNVHVPKAQVRNPAQTSRRSGV